MLSRVAETLYWMSRYLERAENTARLVQTEFYSMLDMPKGSQPSWHTLIDITGSTELFNQHYDQINEVNTMDFFLANEKNPGSLISSLSAARSNARTVRDIMLRETFEAINELHLYAKENISLGLYKHGRHNYLDSVIKRVQTVIGIMQGTMNRDEGYRLIGIARALERADMTSRIIDVRSVQLDQGADLRIVKTLQWSNVLRSISGYQMYRRKVQDRVRGTDVVKFILLDDTFPRAIFRCIDRIIEHLSHLPNQQSCLAKAENMLNELTNSKDKFDGPWSEWLHAYIDNIQQQLADLHDEIAKSYF